MDYYSGCGIDELLNGPIKTLTDAGIILRLSIDGDVKLKAKLKSVKGVEVEYDIAHLKKNIQKNVKGRVQGAGFMGDSNTKIGKKNFTDLCFAIKTAEVQCVEGVREKGWSEDDVINRMSASVDHHAGYIFFI